MSSMLGHLTLFLVLLLLSPAIVDAQDSGPTKVFVAMYVISVDNIDIRQQSYDAEFYLWFKWNGTCSPERYELLNARNITKIFEVKGKDSAGNQYISARMHATFRGELDVSKYPLDKHVLSIEMEDFDWNDSNLVYQIDTVSTGMAQSPKGSEWRVAALGPSVCQRDFGPDHVRFAHYRYSFVITRLFGPFLIKVLVPLLIVVAMSMLSFFVPPEDLQTQASIGATSLLSIIAFHLAIGGQLPDVGYPTIADILMMGTYVFVFLALVESIWVNVLFKNGKVERAGRIDKRCRLCFPVCYLLFGGMLGLLTAF